jgi:hypothetical protein
MGKQRRGYRKKEEGQWIQKGKETAASFPGGVSRQEREQDLFSVVNAYRTRLFVFWQRYGQRFSDWWTGLPLKEKVKGAPNLSASCGLPRLWCGACHCGGVSCSTVLTALAAGGLSHSPGPHMPRARGDRTVIAAHQLREYVGGIADLAPELNIQDLTARDGAKLLALFQQASSWTGAMLGVRPKQHAAVSDGALYCIRRQLPGRREGWALRGLQLAPSFIECIASSAVCAGRRCPPLSPPPEPVRHAEQPHYSSMHKSAACAGACSGCGKLSTPCSPPKKRPTPAVRWCCLWMISISMTRRMWRCWSR